MKGRAILETVALKHRLKVSDLKGRTLRRPIVRARREAMQMMRALGMSTTLIGRICERDHTTVIFHTTPGARERKKASRKPATSMTIQ